MPLERPHIARKQSEANRASAVAVIDAVDQRRQFLAPVIVGREQVRLMLVGGDQVEQHDVNGKRLVARDPFPQLLEAREQESGVARLMEIAHMARRRTGRPSATEIFARPVPFGRDDLLAGKPTGRQCEEQRSVADRADRSAVSERRCGLRRPVVR